MNRRVLVTGMGCVSGLGRGVASNWERVEAGRGAIRSLDRDGARGIAAWSDGAAGDASRLASLDADVVRRLGRLDPLSAFAIEAALEAIDDAGLRGGPALSTRTAITIGCGSGGNATIETAYERLFAQGQAKVHPQTVPGSMITAPAAHLAMLLGVHGPVFTLSSACASSAHALGEAMHLIRSGRADVVVAGGTEACLTRGCLTAWQSLGVLAPDACRPFSRDRRGMVLGEGAAVLVLEAEEHARARGATAHAEFAGYGLSSDAAHMTAPDLDGIVAALSMAIADAGVSPDAPALVSAHGTGTTLNDAAETAALHRVYGRALENHRVIATKSAHGHMIGTTGAIEFVLGLLALKREVAPPVLGYLGADPACDLPLALEREAFAADYLLSSSFAFGGLNAVLIGRRA